MQVSHARVSKRLAASSPCEPKETLARRAHKSNNKKTDCQTGRAGVGERLSGTDEEASTDTASDSDHVQMSTLERLVELVVFVCQGAFLEGLGGTAHTRPEAQLRLAFDGALIDGMLALLAVDGKIGNVGVDADLGILLVLFRHVDDGRSEECDGKEKREGSPQSAGCTVIKAICRGVDDHRETGWEARNKRS